MKIRLLSKIVLLVAALVFLTACGAPVEETTFETSPADATQVDKACPTGMTTYDVEVNDMSFISGTLDVQVVRPNPGCKIPAAVCYTTDISYGGGISCFPLEPNE